MGQMDGKVLALTFIHFLYNNTDGFDSYLDIYGKNYGTQFRTSADGMH
jgi:hypothetical protein